MQRRTQNVKVLTLHSLLVSMTLSPSTRPQLPHTRSPLLNSSTMCGFMSLQSGQMRRTARSGPYEGCWAFCVVAASGKGCANAMCVAPLRVGKKNGWRVGRNHSRTVDTVDVEECRLETCFQIHSLLIIDYVIVTHLPRS